MKNVFILTFTIFLVAFTACNPAPKAESKLAGTDSLMMQWNNAWNASNADQIAALFTDKAILVSAGGVIIGIDSIKVKMINRSVLGLKNLKTEMISESVSTDFASQTGSYSHDWINKDSTIAKESGMFTFIWQKQADKSWKLALIHM